MLNLQTPAESPQLDFDQCDSCSKSCGWKLVETWMWSQEESAVIPLTVWVPCFDCNRSERKPKPWDS